MSELCRFIHAEKANYPIVLLCRVLHVARSSYYAWREGEAGRHARQAADDALAREITVLHVASRCTYGVPRIHAELRRLGQRVNRKRIARVMRERDIRGVTRRKRSSLTRPDKKAKPAPDLIGRDFHAERPGIKLVGDITYLPTAEGWLYLACRLDLATREVVGYAMADHHRAELVVDALDMAYGRGNLEPGCVIHSDRGSEYTSTQFSDRIRELGLRNSCERARIMLRQRGRGEFLGPAQGRDRHPHLARPGHSPRRGLHLHRETLLLNSREFASITRSEAGGVTDPALVRGA
ncbi:IS3 family transposase [Streptomyces sp. HUAS TT20]|uniref:IS3 family transposase n=1 Tax=Streptomyces sp. HUAS TT20 TaxID=3447509 RepID=UPI0021DA69D0|nr:IS3 family transposase [Streptomyces sp. HUAS 15-9]UXY32195.1 IS3 family transposase [Streptomyces sp. HUAS 15-9]